MNAAQLREGLIGVAMPGMAGLLFALAGFWLGSYLKRRNDRSKIAKRIERLGPPIGFGLGYLLVLLSVQGTPPTLKLSSISASHWQLIFLCVAIVFALAESFSLRATKQPAIRWFGRFVLVAGVLVFQLSSARKYQWEPGVEQIAWTAGVGLWMLFAFGALDLLSVRARVTSASLSLAAIPALAIPAIFDSGATAQWQIALAVASALFGIALVGMIFRERYIGQALGTIYIVWLGGMLVVAHLYSEMPAWRAGLLAALPFAVLIPERWPKLCRHRRFAIRMAIIAAVCLAVSWGAIPGFLETLTGGGGSSDYDYYSMAR
ncbi:MAG: hypothetical protein COB69_01615 [Phycisphaera sp.]|nr:MAG: hypothetical protein COB69_01615 [Phycisphaera sp.]